MPAPFRRFLLALAFACAPFVAAAQAVGHLNVPAAQMVHATMWPQNGLAQNIYYFNGYTMPEGTQVPWSSGLLKKQALVFTHFTVVVFRAPTSNPIYAETGEVWLGDYDAASKGKPLGDQFPLTRYTIPVGETRVVLQIPLAPGHAYMNDRQPAIINYVNPNTQLNVRGWGYLLPG